MIALRDDGVLRFEVREDIAASHKLCPTCRGDRFVYHNVGNVFFGGVAWFFGPYERRCDTCLGTSLVQRSGEL